MSWVQGKINLFQVYKQFLVLGSLIFSILYGSVYAEEPLEPEINVTPPAKTHVNWAFSGIVTNETGDNFGYFFQMQRDDERFQAITALFDAQSRRIILHDSSSAAIINVKNANWQVGRPFLQFNPINDSWIFGLKTKDKKGFNFKVDMLSQAGKSPITQLLRPGVELIVSQTGHLNGHIQGGMDSKEQFVTAKNAWFRQVSLSENQTGENQPFSGVLCRFNDGSGFYSVSMQEADTLRGSVAGSCDAEGTARVTSQFIKVEEDKKGRWHIRVHTPNYDLVLSDEIKQSSLIAGFVTKDELSGFCLVSKDMLGLKPSELTAVLPSLRAIA